MSSPNSCSLSRSIVLLDGGMGQELLARSGCKPTPLWSAQVMMDMPDLVRELHMDYIRAGARVITLNTYSATPERLEREGVADLFESNQALAVRIAHEARDACGIDGVRIAGCLPPLVTSYQPQAMPAYDVALDTYRKIVAQQADHVDLILCETMGSVKEAQAAATAAKESLKPVWVAMTVKDDLSGVLRSGESLAKAHVMLDRIDVAARLLNCSLPEAIAAAWPQFTKSAQPLGVYANGFTSVADLEAGLTVDALSARGDLDPDTYADHVVKWVETGATIVGGCCEIGPPHIAALSSRLQSQGYDVSGVGALA